MRYNAVQGGTAIGGSLYRRRPCRFGDAAFVPFSERSTVLSSPVCRYKEERNEKLYGWCLFLLSGGVRVPKRPFWSSARDLSAMSSARRRTDR
ncbi:MAG: hypothetical protein ACLRSW_13315 [Christensenellaceae bacterium]